MKEKLRKTIGNGEKKEKQEKQLRSKQARKFRERIFYAWR